MNDLTIILPTHNRHHYLKRWLEMNRKKDYHIIIVDSSEKAFEDILLLGNNINYLHEKEMDLFDKIQKAFTLITTKYSLLYPDDDYIFDKTIIKAIDFLDLNNDYVCVHGQFITFTNMKEISKIDYMENLISRNLTSENKGYIVDSNILEERLVQISSPYKCLVWSIFRTETHKHIFSTISKIKSVNEAYLFEFLTAIIASIDGKIKELNSLFYLRENIINSDASSYQWVSILVKEKDISIQQAKDLIIPFLVKKGYTKDYAEKILEVTFNTYVYNFFPKWKNKRDKEIHDFSQKKEKLPKFIWILYRKITNKWIRFKLILKDKDILRIERIIKKYNI